MKASRRLQPLLNLQQLRRRVLKQLLYTLNLRRTELERRLDALAQERLDVRRWNGLRLQEGQHASDQRLTEHWHLKAEARDKELRRQLDELLQQCREAEERLVKASQELKMLSTLQERRLAREAGDALKAQQRDLDEMASQRTGAGR